ncbi:MAG: hypothetical protein ACREGR_02160 [Minisyncoccia bacterium]
MGFIVFMAAVALILYVLFAPTKASADGYAIVSPHGTTLVVPLGSAAAKIINVPQDLSADTQDQIRKWESFCKPMPVVGHYGVTFLHYAHEGCEFGRTQ